VKFSDFVGQTSKTEVPKGAIVEGGFSCQECYEQVDEAEYFRIEKILKWKCSEGHVSYVEEFTL
jgi:hypothetical protein